MSGLIKYAANLKAKVFKTVVRSAMMFKGQMMAEVASAQTVSSHSPKHHRCECECE